LYCACDNESGLQVEPGTLGGYCICGDWASGPDSGGLGLPNMADKMEYSRLAASDPKEKLGSNGTLKRGSPGEKDSAA
jgi:hypothetical protein